MYKEFNSRHSKCCQWTNDAEHFKIWDSQICIAFSKLLQKDKKSNIHNLENKINVVETKTHNGKNMKFYNWSSTIHKQEFNEIFNNVGEGIRIQSRCQ